MAFLAKSEKDEEDELLQGTKETSQPLSGGGGLLGAETGGSGDAEVGTGSGPTEGGSQTNVRTYGQKNQPATQRLADKVGQSVRDRGDTARNTLGQQSTAFSKAVEDAEVRDDVGLRNQVLADPTALTKDAERTAQFKKMRDAEYKGPQNFSDTDFYEPVSSAYNEANQARERLKSSGGRQELILGVSRPGQRVSAGRTLLDEALLSSDPYARGALREAGDSLGDLDQRLADANSAAAARARQAQQTTAATREATRGTLGQARNEFETGLDTRVTTARDEANKRAEAARAAMEGGFSYSLKNGQLYNTTSGGYDELSDDLIARTGMTRQELANALQSGGTGPGTEFMKGRKHYLVRPDIQGVSDQALADIGIDRDQYNMLFGSGLDDVINQYRSKGVKESQLPGLQAEFFRTLGDPDRFLKTRSADEAITRGNLASEDDYARLDALNALADEQNIFLDPSQRAQAGTANLDLTDLDRNEYVSAAENALTNAIKKSYELRNLNAKSSTSGSFAKKFGGSIASGGLLPKGSSIKDFGKTLQPGSDQFKHIIDPRTPIEMPGGIAGVGGDTNPFTLIKSKPYDAVTRDAAYDEPNKVPTEEELNELRSLV